MNDELRKNVRLRWLDSLFEFAHYEFQKKAWLEAAFENYVSDYSESICKYFDDLDLDTGFDRFTKEGFATQEEFDILNEFHNQLRNYTDRPEKRNLSDQNVLKDVEWIELTKKAKLNWEKLKNEITDNVEKNYMLNLENKFIN